MTHHTSGSVKGAVPLAGVRILDLSTVVAGPFGSEILASLGADVVRVEPPAKRALSSPVRPYGPVSDEDGFFYALQRNKGLVQLDLKTPEGHAAFLDLVRGADVVYENFRSGVMQRLGIDHAALSAINPRIISCAISGFGSTGPWAKVGAYDVAVQALGGSMSITGNGPDSLPCRWGVPIGDIAGSFYGAIGVIAALRERETTCVGQAIEVALLDGQLALNTYRVPQALGGGIAFEAPAPRKGGAGTVPYGPFQCGDGAWIVIGVASNFWRSFCAVIGRPDLLEDPRYATLADRQAHQDTLDAELEREMLRLSAEDWQARLIEGGVPVGKVNTIPEAFAHPQTQGRSMTSTMVDEHGRTVAVAANPIRFVGEDAQSDRAPLREARAPAAKFPVAVAPPPSDVPLQSAIARLAALDGPLAGMLVLELCGDEPSGTFGTQILADLGATIVKIERPGKAGETRDPLTAPGVVRPDVAYFFGLNRNKRSLCLDLKAAAGRDSFLKLAARADAIYSNYKPGVLDRLGLGADTLSQAAPRAIQCLVSGFGQTGPWSQQPAYDATIQALGGGMSLTGTGEEGAPPVRWGNPIGGIGGAFYAVIGILSALYRRDRTGQPARLDIALLDAQLAMHAYRVAPALSGRDYRAEPRRGGSGALPYGPFQAGDGRWFALGITAQFWPTAAKLLGHPEWVEDPRFETEPLRQRNEVELNRLVSEAMQGCTADEWQDLFVTAGIPGAKVQTIPEAFQHPHVAPRDMLMTFDHPVGRHLKVAGNPIKLSRYPQLPFAAAPGLGADSEHILAVLAGLDEQTIDGLRRSGTTWWPDAGLSYDRPSVV